MISYTSDQVVYQQFHQFKDLKQKLCCYKTCCVRATAITLVVVLLLVLILALVFGLKDYNQCQRACQMEFQKNFTSFMLFSKENRRHNSKICQCTGGYYVARQLKYTNTLVYDKTVNEYCICVDDLCFTVYYKPESFLHRGPCGACSNPNDYEVYVRTAQTLTKYSTKAAALAIFSEKSATKMMAKAGFTEACSTCWVGNMQNTLQHCFAKCAFGSRASCGKDGMLTPCLQCDENYSGLYFRQCAGMTRRRAGIVSDICRQEGEIE